MFRFLSIVALLVWSLPALAQSGKPTIQSGNVTPAHASCWTTNGIIQDCGTAAIPFLTSIGTVGQGQTICAWSALSTAPGSQKLCFGVFDNSPATITLQNFGIDTPQTLNFVLNGTTYPFPFVVGGIVGPGTTIVNDGACWNNTVGTLLKECSPLVLLNGSGNGLGWKNSVGTKDAQFNEFSSGNLLLQMGGANNFQVTDSHGNSFANFQGEQPTNGAWTFNLTSGHCGIGDEDLTVSGTPTATEQPGFTLTIGATTATVTYTVQPGDTNNMIAAGLAAAAQANTTFKSLVNGTCPDGNAYNGAVTAVALGNNQMGFDPIWTANPLTGGNSFSGINSTHTTITTFPVNTLTGALYTSEAIFIAGRNAAAGDVPAQHQLIYQDASGNPAAYFTETYSVISASALRIDKGWVMGPCGFDFSTTTGVASFESNSNCDLSLIANGATTNNVNISTGNAGAINLTPGAGGVVDVALNAAGVVCNNSSGKLSTTATGCPSFVQSVATGGTGASTLTGALKGNGTSPVTQAACADLSDSGTACQQPYTASTWTPVITTDGTPGTPAYGTQLGTYEKIGRQVTARFNITLSGWTGSPTGNVEISGLPVANSGNYGTCTVSFYSGMNLTASVNGMTGLISDTASLIVLYQTGNTAAAKVVSLTNFGTTGTVVGSCNYHS